MVVQECGYWVKGPIYVEDRSLCVWPNLINVGLELRTWDCRFYRLLLSLPYFLALHSFLTFACLSVSHFIFEFYSHTKQMYRIFHTLLSWIHLSPPWLKKRKFFSKFWWIFLFYADLVKILYVSDHYSILKKNLF